MRNKLSRVAEYKHVYYQQYARGRLSANPYNGRFTYKGIPYDCGWYGEAKLAALAVDKQKIRLGLDPVNVLKKVN